MTIPQLRKLVERISNQTFARHWVAYGSNGLNDPGRGLAIAILAYNAQEAERWVAVLTREATPPREWVVMQPPLFPPYLLAFWDRTEE